MSVDCDRPGKKCPQENVLRFGKSRYFKGYTFWC